MTRIGSVQARLGSINACLSTRRLDTRALLSASQLLDSGGVPASVGFQSARSVLGSISASQTQQSQSQLLGGGLSKAIVQRHLLSSFDACDGEDNGSDSDSDKQTSSLVDPPAAPTAAVAVSLALQAQQHPPGPSSLRRNHQ